MGEAAAAVADKGTWRKGEFVRWTDLFIVIEATLVWIGVLFLIGFTIAAGLIATGQQPDSLQKSIAGLSKDPRFLFAIMASYDLVLLYFFWRIARRVSTASLVARYRSTSLRALGSGILAGVVLGLAVPLLNAYLVQKNIIDLRATKNEELMASTTLAQLPYAIIAIGLVAPFTEELFFRGLLLSWLKRKMPLFIAIVVSALVFAALHFSFVSHPGTGGWYVTGLLASIGLLNAVLAVRTGSLWAPFGLHAAYNTTLVSAPFLLQALR